MKRALLVKRALPGQTPTVGRTRTRDQFCLTQEATTANHDDFFLRVFSGEDLVCYSCDGRYCIGQEPDGTEVLKQKGVSTRGPKL